MSKFDVKIPVDALGREVRSATLKPEQRAAATDQNTLAGYAALFNEYSEQLGGPYGFVEIIEPGFFDDALQDDVRCLWQHDANFVLGRTRNNTLTIEQDAVGLRFAAQPPVTPPDAATWALDALIAIKRGDVDQCSFAFEVKPGGDEWYMLGDKVVRRLKVGGCARLYDVSPVTYPAYSGTSVQARSMSVDLARTQPADHLPQGDGERIRNSLALNRRRLELLGKI